VTNPRLAFQGEDGGRRYRHPKTGDVVPSITTVIGVLAKPALVPWAVKLTADAALDHLSALNAAAGVPVCKAKRVADECGQCTECVVKRIKRVANNTRDDAADLGSRLHEYAEAWAKDEPTPPITEDLRPFVSAFRSFLDDQQPKFEWIEATVWSYTHGYAGTLDFVAVMDGLWTFGDYKTGKAVYPEVGLQIAAAARADCILAPDGTEYPVPQAERAVGVHIRPKGYTVHEVTHLDECFDGFLGALDAYRWKAGVAQGVLQ
jgi:hypothetical protein